MQPEPLDAITAGGIAYVDDRMDEARDHWERAFRQLRDAGQPAAAARVATLLAELHWGGLGNASIGRGWLERAGRLLDESGACVERGYWELARLACDRLDPVEVAASAMRALQIAAEFGDAGLHMRALADLGYALICQGRLAAGFAHLDEALACLSSGDVSDPWALSTTCCALLSAGERLGDAERADDWLRVVRDLVLAPAGGRPRMLGAHCQLALSGVLFAAGQWQQAEDAVRTVLDRGGGATAAQRTAATARLAELHIQRGKVADAAALLTPIEDETCAAGPLAQVHLARGAPELALAVLLRATTTLGGDVLRRAELLAEITQIALRCEHLDQARDAAAQLRGLAADTDAEVVRGLADLADGLYSAARGATDKAVPRLQAAHTGFTRTHRPLLAAQAALALGELATSSADAVAAARAAHAIAVRLDVPGLRDRSAALLRQHGVAAPRTATTDGADKLTPRESQILDGLRRGDTNAEIAAQLFLSPKTVEHHVSRVLSKLGVRTRAEAAAIAAAAQIQRRAGRSAASD